MSSNKQPATFKDVHESLVGYATDNMLKELFEPETEEDITKSPSDRALSELFPRQEPSQDIKTEVSKIADELSKEADRNTALRNLYTSIGPGIPIAQYGGGAGASPEQIAALASSNMGPQPPGGWDELNRPLDEYGKPYPRFVEGERVTREPGRLMSKPSEISQGKDTEYNILERTIKKISSLLNLPSPLAKDKGISDSAKAQGLVNLMAREAGIPVDEFRESPVALEQAAKGFTDVVSFGLLPAMERAESGIEDYEISSAQGYVGRGLGMFAGLVLGPASIRYATGKAAEVAGSALAGTGAVKWLGGKMPVGMHLLKQGLREAAQLGPIIGAAGIGKAAEEVTFGDAASTLVKETGSGAVTGMVFGLARGIFPVDVSQRAARIISGWIMLNAQRAIEDPKGSPWNRPLHEVVFDTAMDTFFLWKGLSRGDFNKVAELTERIKEIRVKEAVVETIPDEKIKDAQKQVLEVQIKQAEIEAAELMKKVNYRKWIEEDLRSTGEVVKKIKQLKKYSADEAINKVLERIRPLKPVKEAKEVKEAKVKEPKPKVEKKPKAKKPIVKEPEPEPEKPKIVPEEDPHTDVDLLTGRKLPQVYDTDTSPYRKDPETTQFLSNEFATRIKWRENIDQTTQKLLNDVNKWLDGDDSVNINETRNALSMYASRADELRHNFESYDVESGVDPFLDWKDTVRDAAIWARQAERAELGGRPLRQKIERSEEAAAEEPIVREPERWSDEETRQDLADISEMEKLYGKTIDKISNEEIKKFYIDRERTEEVDFFGEEGDEVPEVDISIRKSPVEAKPVAKPKPLTKSERLELMKKIGRKREGLRELDQVDQDITLNVAIPINAIPQAVKDVLKSTKVLAKDIFRNEEIWRRTGFWFAQDGKWRYEIDEGQIEWHPSKDARIGYKERGLGADSITDALDYPDLFKAIPELKNLLVFYDKNIKDNAYYNGGDVIRLKRIDDKKALIHELQHAVNRKAGSRFLGSAYPDNLKYLTDQGEMEARLAEARMNMSAGERAKIPPWETLDSMLGMEKFTKDMRIRKEHGKKLYSGVPVDKIWKEMRTLEEDLHSRIAKWLRGETDKRPVPSAIYRGVPKGKSESIEGAEYVHGTPWPYQAAKGGKGGFGDPTSHDVYQYPYTKDTLFYRGGSLAGDPLEKTRIKNAKGMTWDQLLDEAKDIYESEILRIKARNKERYRQTGESTEYLERDIARDVKYEAERIADDFLKASFETDINKRPGIWRGKTVPYELDKEFPRLRSNDELMEIVTQKRRQGFEDEDIPELKILNRQRGPDTTLYSGVSVDKISQAARDTVNAGKRYWAAFRKDIAATNPKTSVKMKEAKLALDDMLMDTKKVVRQALLDARKKGVIDSRATAALHRIINEAGGSAYGQIMFEQFYKEVYGDKSSKLRELINGVIKAERIKDIAKYKKVNFPKDQGPAEAIAGSILVKELEKLSPSEAKDINTAVQGYFAWMKAVVDDMEASGFISKEMADGLKSHNYAKFKGIGQRLEDGKGGEIDELFDFTFTPKKGARKLTSSGIEHLQKGKRTDILEPDQAVVAMEIFNRVYGRIANHEMIKSFVDVATNHPENPLFRLSGKARPEGYPKAPPGWAVFPYWVDGNRFYLKMHPAVAESLSMPGKEVSQRAAFWLKLLSLSPLLKFTATAAAPMWSLFANLPKDIFHAYTASHVYEGGKSKPIYNPIPPVFALQLGRDYASTFYDTFFRAHNTLERQKFMEYASHGGMMPFLALQARDIWSTGSRGKKLPGEYNKILDAMTYFSSSLELWTRLAVHERVLRREAALLGKSIDEVRKDPDYQHKATAMARDMLDFAQGGWFTKVLDQIGGVFVNAATQGGRSFWRQSVEDPVGFWTRMGIFFATSSMLTMASHSINPEAVENTPDYVKEGNICFYLPKSISRFTDEEGQERDFFFKLPIDQSIAFFKTLSESLTEKYLYESGIRGKEPDYDTIVGSLTNLLPVDLGSMHPSLQAFTKYAANVDTWRRKQVVPNAYDWPMSEVEYTPGVTKKQWEDFGKLTKLSPDRSKAFFDSIIANNIFSYAAGYGYEKAFGDIPEDIQKEHFMLSLSKVPGTGRIIGVTDSSKGRSERQRQIVQETMFPRERDNKMVDFYAKSAYWKGSEKAEKALDEYIGKYSDDRKVWKRLSDRAEFIRDTKDLQHRSEWLRMYDRPVEARARDYVERMKLARDKEAFAQEAAEVARIGGFFSEDFWNEVYKLEE